MLVVFGMNNVAVKGTLKLWNAFTPVMTVAENHSLVLSHLPIGKGDVPLIVFDRHDLSDGAIALNVFPQAKVIGEVT